MRHFTRLLAIFSEHTSVARIFHFSRGLKLVLGVVGVLVWNVGSGQVSENFDGWTGSGYGNHNYNNFDINDGLRETSNSLSGSAVRLNDNTLSSLEYVGADGNGKDGGIGDISFWYRSWDSSPTANYNVQISVNNGAFTNIGSAISTSSTTYVEWTHSLNNPSDNLKVRVIRTNGERLIIDDFEITNYAPPCSAEPTVQATDIDFTNNSSTSVDVEWTGGTGGDEYILVAREANAVGFTPTDGTDYSGGDGGGDFTAATDLGSGNKVVYSGSGTSTTVTGLVAGTTYYFQVFAVCVNSSRDYLTSSGAVNDGTQNYIVPLLIPDDGCGSNELESNYLYSGISSIGDMNLFVSISHTYRGDLRIELESPDGTIVQVLGTATGGTADNLEVIFDDEAVISLAGGIHSIDGIADQTVNSTTDPLSDFDGEDPNGTWILRVCDNAGGDIGSLEDWSLDIQPGAAPCSAEPIAQATNIVFTPNSPSSVDVAWTGGTGGDEYILVARETSAVSWTPTDNNDYSGATSGGDFSVATDQGSGNKVVYAASGTSTTITGLTAGTTYYFQSFIVCTGDNHNYLTNTATNNDGNQDYTVQLLIPDNGCGTNELSTSFEYSGVPVIGDVNLFVSITHTFRGDLEIELESPDGTVVSIMSDDGGAEDNIDVIFDDQGTSGFSINPHVIGGGADETIQSFHDPLGNFVGENPNGDWILRVCDDAGGDLGVLEDWYPIVTGVAPEPTNHITNLGCFSFGSSEIDLIWDDATGGQLPDGYLVLWSDIDFTSIPLPVDGTPIPDGANALNVASTIESAAAMGLTQNTDYYFLVYPYTNSGGAIDYKTNGTIPGTTCITDPGPCAFETFDNAGSDGSYGPIDWTGENGVLWSATDARSDDDLGADEAIMLRNGSLTNTTTVPGGCGEISFNYASAYGSNSTLKVFVNSVQYSGDISVTSTSSNFFSTVVNIGGPITVELENSGNRTLISNLSWTCTAGCSPTQTISGFTPLSGPANTLVTITGTGFTGATDVLIGGVSASSFTEISDTELTASVATGSLTGQIEVIVGGCGRLSTVDFEFLDQNLNCGGSGGGPGTYASDLFISEVYDAQSGSLSYIEIFNGTMNAVDFSMVSYSIRINTGAINDYNLIGSVNSGETYILRLGGGSSICSNFTPDFTPSPSQGFNGDDIVILRKAGVDLDYVPNPYSSSNPGFSQSRNNTVTGPTTTYDSNEWTIAGNENCSDLGFPPYTPAGKNITINSHPDDVDCAAVTFTVDATSTENDPDYVPTTYTWRYVAPGDASWSLVSSLNGSNGLVVTGANTITITITGNTSTLLDYQFYVDMGTGGTGECRKYSDVASYTFNTKAYYRTVSNGDWSDLNIWEMADNEGGPYTSPVCQYPIDRTSNKIAVLHDVDLDVEIGADWIVIDPTSTLSLGANNKLTLLNGNPAGADLQVNGTLIDNGNSANGIEFFNDESTWEIAATATIIKTSSSFATRYRDAYETGIINIPATANWIYRFTNNGNLSFANSSGTTPMYYPNLILENMHSSPVSSNVNNGSPNLSSFTMTTGNHLEILGNFDVGGNGTSTINFSNINTYANPVLVHGELIVRSGNTLRNTGGNSTNFGSGFEIQGDLSIDGTLDLSAGTGSSIGVLELSGAQDVIGVGGTNVMVNHFFMNKDNDFNGLADLSFEIEESADFTNGVLELDNASNMVSFGSGATVTNASNASFVDGRVRKSSVGEDFIFPVGDIRNDTSLYLPVRMFQVDNPSTIEAQYFAEAHPNAGSYYDGESNTTFDFHEIGNCDYWFVNDISGDARIGLTHANSEEAHCNEVGGTPFLNYSVWNGFLWDQIPSGTTVTEVNSIGTINGGAPGSMFGAFALSSNSFQNVLPIELTYFDAKALQATVMTTWETSTETNNDYFTIERSADAVHFEEIGRVDGAGTSHEVNNYRFEDLKPFTGISYYRLKQTDFDGAFAYSDIRSVEMAVADGFELINAYRSESNLNLVYRSVAPYLLVEIYDVTGQRVFGDLIENYGSFSSVQPKIQRGAYVVRLSHGGESETRKFVW